MVKPWVCREGSGGLSIMGEGNDGGLWGDPLGEGQGQKV